MSYYTIILFDLSYFHEYDPIRCTHFLEFLLDFRKQSFFGCDMMKTFKLKSLIICFENDERLVQQYIPIIDGLIIDREDDLQQWIIEAYMNQSYKDFFTLLNQEQSNLILQVKITKETNDPAFFLCKMIDMNDIENNMNVLFKGSIIDRNDEVYGNWIKKIEG